MDTTDTIRQAVTALDTTMDLARWAHADGWLASAPNPDRPTRVPPPPEPGAPRGGPDDQPGPRYDLGIGNHSARQAYGAACAALNRADGYLAAATGRTRNPLPHLHPGTTLAQLEGTVDVLTQILLMAGAAAERRILGGGKEQLVLRACTAIYSAHDQLAAALNRGPADPASRALENRCRICGRRPVDPSKKIGQVCPDCRNANRAAQRAEVAPKKGKKRRKGWSQAVKRVGDFRQAIEAQDRRRQRGDSDPIAESLSCVTVHQGEWPTEHPGPGATDG